jgi:hypothetical protein
VPLDSDLKAILVHVEYIREKMDDLEVRASEDRQIVQDHIKEDLRQFGLIWTRLSRISGAMAVIVFLVGAGTAVARLVLD